MRLLAAAGTAGTALGTGACAPGVPPGAGARKAPPAAPAAAEAKGAARVDALLERLTLDEKTALLHGAPDPDSLGQAGYVPGVPRLGIPALRLADGPAGVRVARPATALPAPVLLASAFDPALAREYGRVIGREGRALGQDVLLSPMVNLIRTPYAGRNFETFAEDPRLTADLVGEMIRGIQDEGLIATVKHFALNNQEHGRDTVDVIAASPPSRPSTRPSYGASRPPWRPARARSWAPTTRSTASTPARASRCSTNCCAAAGGSTAG
ncbi:glycoside hydrolase family 3 N-terminal domain-containing protein [Streptomyces sp. NPDC059742]